MRTLQEWFDAAYIGLASQGFEQSIGVKARCAYQSVTGCCAIGWGMPEALRAEADEKDLVVIDILQILGEDLSLEGDLCGLQQTHDRARSPREMQEDLLDFAFIKRLSVPTTGDDK